MMGGDSRATAISVSPRKLSKVKNASRWTLSGDEVLEDAAVV